MVDFQKLIQHPNLQTLYISRPALYPLQQMIQSFKDADTRELFETGSNKRWKSVEKAARRKLDQIEAVAKLADLRTPRGNRLQALKGDQTGQHSVRINDQFRICFTWKADGAHEVEITDYH